MPESTDNRTGNVVEVKKPEAGTAINVASQTGSNVRFDFDPTQDADITRPDGTNDLRFVYDDGSEVVLSDFFAVGDQALPALVLPDGTIVDVSVAFAGMDIDLSPAAGPGAGAAAGSGGVGDYSADAGAFTDGIDRLGTTDPFYWGGGEERAELLTQNIFTPFISITTGTPTPNDNWTVEAGGANVIMDEADLANGSRNTSGSPNPTATVNFNVTTNDGLASITINGSTYNVVGGKIAGFPDAGIAGANGTLTDPVLALQPDGTYSLSFTYNFESAHGHSGSGADMAGDVDSFIISASSVNGATSENVYLNVDIIDDIPVVSITADATHVEEGATITGDWDITYGADAKGEFDTTGEARAVVYNGKEYAFGESIDTDHGTLVVKADGTWEFTAEDNPYKTEDRDVTFSIKAVDGDGDVVEAPVSFTVTDEIQNPDVTTVRITTNNVKESDGGEVVFDITLSNAPDPSFGGKTYVNVTIGDDPTIRQVEIDANGKGQLSIPHGNDEDVYKDGSSITVKVVDVEGGNYEDVDVSGATATAKIDDTESIVNADVKLTTDENGDLVVNVSLTNKDGISTAPGEGQTTTVTVDLGDKTVEVEIKGNETTGSVTVEDFLDSVYDDKITVEAVVTDVEHSGKDFEKVVMGDDKGSFAPIPVDTSYTISTDNYDEADGKLTFDIEFTNPPKGGSGIVEIILKDNTGKPVGSIDGKHTVTIGADGKGKLVVDNPNTEDVYKDPSSVTATVGDINCGYSDPDVTGNGSTTANIEDTIDPTTAKVTGIVAD
ncbi:hypothetical protein LJC48_07625, partial [Desulfovibrio sp. OttesenSCG-928-C06]|nr:hypothetical protein [Desulfovibrio sp. OttesenSCG-928-C06]